MTIKLIVTDEDFRWLCWCLGVGTGHLMQISGQNSTAPNVETLVGLMNMLNEQFKSQLNEPVTKPTRN